MNGIFFHPEKTFFPGNLQGACVLYNKIALMKRFSILSITLLLLSLTPGCKEETAIENAPYVHISGNNISAFHETTPVRASTDETFPASSIISFYSEGALSASGIPLTWTGQHWESKEPLVWTNASPSAEIKAYYPADVFESQKLYNDAGELADILFASQSSQSGNINLTFGHLFSKITFRIAHSFNHRIQKLTITPSHLVSFIHAMEASVTAEENTGNLSLTREVNPEGIYSLIVPSGIPLSLSLKITCSGKEYVYELPEQVYTPGVAYLHPINSRQPGVGIDSVEDYIAFTHLINGYEYEGRSLEEFGETIDGETIYYLLKDLTFTEETSEEVMEIGWKDYYNNSPFNDTFEGNYHVIKGLNLTGKSGQPYFAIFGYIGEKGKVSNLVIEDLFIHITDSESIRIGGIAGYNSGVIDNCLLHNFTTHSESSYEDMNAGGICFINFGTIQNCTATSITISGNYIGTGGITYKNQSEITNCHISSLKSPNRKKCAAISYVVDTDCRLTNVLCSKISGNVIHTYGSPYIAEHCYYPSSINLSFDNDYSKEFIPYQEENYQCTDGTAIETVLNQWILSNGQALQPWIRTTDQTVTLNTYGY